MQQQLTMRLAVDQPLNDWECALRVSLQQVVLILLFLYSITQQSRAEQSTADR